MFFKQYLSGGYLLRVIFNDGVQGEVDISALVEFTGIFAPLEDDVFFRQVTVNADIGTICWPNNADIDPDVLYHSVTGDSIPTFLAQQTR